MRIATLAFLLAFTCTADAQQQPNIAAQRDAMKRLAFLAGTWSGDALVIRGPDKPIKVRQTEQVQFKLIDTVLLIEGVGRDIGTGEVLFNALATVSYDDVAGVYRFRAYNDGRYLDTELKVLENGFEWGYKAGPAAVRFLMRLNEKGEWTEIGEVTVGSTPPRKTFDMTLRRQN
jgi:hypothetical protein